jgi:hypothetical protein
MYSRLSAVLLLKTLPIFDCSLLAMYSQLSAFLLLTTLPSVDCPADNVLSALAVLLLTTLPSVDFPADNVSRLSADNSP